MNFREPRPIRAEVLAVLSKSTIRVVLAPGEGQADGGIPCELAIDVVPAALRFPGTKLWVELDQGGNLVSAKPRGESDEH
jgi:hypothetical protein